MKNLIIKLVKQLCSRNVLFSACLSVLLLVFGYFSNNWPLFSGIDLGLYTGITWVKRALNSENTEYPGAFFVNTSFDKQLITVYDGEFVDQEIEPDEDNRIKGRKTITDRSKLLKFLKLLSRTDYGYVVIDLRFVDADHDIDSIHNGPQIDKELFTFIKSMPRCVVATHKNLKLLDGLEEKAALADYKSTVTATNFVKYEYLDSIESIPLHVYKELEKEKHNPIQYGKHGSVYLETDATGTQLCQNCVFLEFSSEGLPEIGKVQETGEAIFIGEFNYKNMGLDYLKDSEEDALENLQNEMKDRPVVYIGNITEDLHDTYAGLQPGVVILYKALDALQKGRHHVSLAHSLLLFVTYFLIIYFAIREKKVLDMLPNDWRKKHMFCCFILEMTSLTTILFVVNLCDILYFHTTTNFFFTLFFLYILKIYADYKKTFNHEKL